MQRFRNGDSWIMAPAHVYVSISGVGGDHRHLFGPRPNADLQGRLCGLVMQMNDEMSVETDAKSFDSSSASQGSDQHCRARSGHQGWHLFASLCASRPRATLS